MKRHVALSRVGAVAFMGASIAAMLVLLTVIAAPASAATPSEYWTSWVSLGKPASGVPMGAPGVGRNEDGRVEIFARDAGTTKAIWHKWQTSANGSWAGTWVSMGRPAGVALLPPVIGANADGRLELYAAGDDEDLWRRYQPTANGDWDDWQAFGKPDGTGITLSPAVASNLDGRLEIFALAGDRSIRSCYQTAPNSGWIGWVSLGKPSASLGRPVAGRNKDGRLQIFSVGDDGRMYTRWQDTPGGAWHAWAKAAALSAGVTAKSVAVGSNEDGRLEAIALGSDGAMWRIYQSAADSTWWIGWTSLGRPTGVTLGDPVMSRNQDGRLEVFAAGGDGSIWHIWQTAANGTWSGWASLGKPAGCNASSPAVGQNRNGRLLLIVKGSDGSIWFKRETGVPVTVTLRQGRSGYAGCTDASINQAATSTNYGSSATLDVQSVDLKAALLRFNLAGALPTGAIIRSATLSVYVHQLTPTSASATVKLFEVQRQWAPGEATWVLARTGIPWGTAGCNNTGSDRAATATATATWDSIGWKSFDVTSLAKSWYATSSENLGVVIKAYGPGGRSFKLRSSDYPTIAARPKLVITYAPK